MTTTIEYFKVTIDHLYMDINGLSIHDIGKWAVLKNNNLVTLCDFPTDAEIVIQTLKEIENVQP